MKLPRSRDSSASFWAGVLMTLAFHAVLIALVQASWPTSIQRSTRPEPPRYTYWIENASPVGPDVWDVDPRALWSPALFALPTRVGFSPPRRKPASVPGALATSDAATLLLERPATPYAPGGLLPRASLEASRRRDHAWASPDPVPDPLSGPHLQPTGLSVEWPFGEPAWLRPLDAGNPELLSGARAWEAVASVTIAADGEVTSVFLTQPTAERERNEAIVRALRRMHAEPGREGRYRVQLYFVPPSATDGSAREPAR